MGGSSSFHSQSNETIHLQLDPIALTMSKEVIYPHDGINIKVAVTAQEIRFSGDKDGMMGPRNVVHMETRTGWKKLHVEPEYRCFSDDRVTHFFLGFRSWVDFTRDNLDPDTSCIPIMLHWHGEGAEDLHRRSVIATTIKAAMKKKNVPVATALPLPIASGAW